MRLSNYAPVNVLQSLANVAGGSFSKLKWTNMVLLVQLKCETRLGQKAPGKPDFKRMAILHHLLRQQQPTEMTTEAVCNTALSSRL